MNQQIEIYQSDEGQTQIKVHFKEDTLWLTQAQMAELFDKDVRTVSEHITTIYKAQELTEGETTIRKFRMVRQEGSRQVKRDVEFEKFRTQEALPI
jgi:hypothetical protein